MSKRYSSGAGFTLVECLVVLAVIGVLAAILLPIFGRVRENGRKAVCQSNLKQLALAVQQYTQDYAGFFPTGGIVREVDGMTHNQSIWPHAISAYVKNSEVFWCLSNTRDSLPVNTNYGYNWLHLNQQRHLDISGWHGDMIAESNVQIPTNVWLHRDTSNGCVWWKDWDTLHSEGANYSFLDGHVKWFTPQAIAESQGADADVPST